MTSRLADSAGTNPGIGLLPDLSLQQRSGSAQLGGSHKWEEIGIALALPEYVREECKSAGSNPVKLSKLLSAWISGKHREAKSTTVHSLKTALASEIVQLTDVSQKLDSFSTPTVFLTTNTSDFVGSRVIEYQSYDTEVAEGKSTLLEVQVGDRGGELCQWSKDGFPLLDGVDYSGVCSNILYINRASQDAQGIYSCCVSRGQETEYTDDINLTVLKLPQTDVNLVKLSNVLVQSEFISADICNKFLSLDHDHVIPEKWLRFLVQQVCMQTTSCNLVSDRLKGLVNSLEGTTQTVCCVLMKELERAQLSKKLELDHQSNKSHSLLVEEISLPYACDCEVTEGKSTLLEVQDSGNSGCESYQWSKDGEILLDGADFFGVRRNIIYIHEANQCSKGKYSCSINHGSLTVCSNEITLRVIFPPDKEELLKYYTIAGKEVPQNSWPPVANPNFINLVLIRQKVKNKYDYYTIRGDIDDIIESKEVAEYETVFKEHREGGLVLIEGRPGSGKTTLVHRITRDWAIGKKILQGSKMVFLVTLRLLNVRGRDKSLLELLENFYGDLYSKDVEHNLRRCKGQGACFILDGLDEYAIECKKNLIIDELLNIKTLLPLSMVIVASRPVATDNLKKKCQTRIEVIGFSTDQIYSYVRSYPFYDCSLPSKMEAFLNQHPNVLHMCYLLIHAAIICFYSASLKATFTTEKRKSTSSLL